MVAMLAPIMSCVTWHRRGIGNRIVYIAFVCGEESSNMNAEAPSISYARTYCYQRPSCPYPDKLLVRLLVAG